MDAVSRVRMARGVAAGSSDWMHHPGHVPDSTDTGGAGGEAASDFCIKDPQTVSWDWGKRKTKGERWRCSKQSQSLPQIRYLQLCAFFNRYTYFQEQTPSFKFYIVTPDALLQAPVSFLNPCSLVPLLHFWYEPY